MHQIGLHAYRTPAVAAVAVALALATGSSTAKAQDHVYFLSYYANAQKAGAPDGTLRLANDANVSDSSPAGDLWASIYVFDNQEHMQECCSCLVTPNGYLAISVNALTSYPLSPGILHRGLIKILSSNNGDPAAPALKPGIRAWITHPEALATNGPYSLSVEHLTDSSLGQAEFADLGEDCGIIATLGVAGPGQCIFACPGTGR